MKLTLENLADYTEPFGECMHWTLGTNGQGYPIMARDGAHHAVRRYVLGTLLGHPLKPRQPVRTRCGHKLCVAPGCLFASSMSAMVRAQWAAGTRNLAQVVRRERERAIARGWARIDQATADRIRAEPAEISHAEVARRYGISQSQASNIRRGFSWRVALPQSSVFAMAGSLPGVNGRWKWPGKGSKRAVEAISEDGKEIREAA